jgi:RsiW-degrading membrane proteinase PrsW (M82 family)
MRFLTQASLVLMAGIYAIRSTYTTLGGEAFSPLSLLAALVFALVFFLFYRLNRVNGKRLYVVIGLCIVGMAVNGVLLFAPGASHANLTNSMFSATCVLGWGIVAAFSMQKLYRPALKAESL